jgi:hypothetical protein
MIKGSVAGGEKKEIRVIEAVVCRKEKSDRTCL